MISKHFDEFVTMNARGDICALDLPREYKTATADTLNAGIERKHYSDRTREELQGAPIFRGLVGPMFNGYEKINGFDAVILHYEISKP